MNVYIREDYCSLYVLCFQDYRHKQTKDSLAQKLVAESRRLFIYTLSKLDAPTAINKAQQRPCVCFQWVFTTGPSSGQFSQTGCVYCYRVLT